MMANHNFLFSVTKSKSKKGMKRFETSLDNDGKKPKHNINWWDYKIDKMIEKEEAKGLWDFRTETEKYLPQHTPHVTIVDNKEKKV